MSDEELCLKSYEEKCEEKMSRGDGSCCFDKFMCVDCYLKDVFRGMSLLGTYNIPRGVAERAVKPFRSNVADKNEA